MKRSIENKNPHETLLKKKSSNYPILNIIGKWLSSLSISTILLLLIFGSNDQFRLVSDLIAQSLSPLISNADQIDAIKVQNAFYNVSKSVNPAVVFISTESELGIKQIPFFGKKSPSLPKGPVQKSLGSGFIISSDGYILTNYHVIRKADKIIVKVEDDKEYDAKLIGSDKILDVALLKIAGTNLPTARLGDSDRIRVGDWAVAIGNPYGLSHSFTVGVVSHVGRENLDVHGLGKFIQTDAAINQGNSGGPLLNINGQVIGINRMIFSQSGGSVGIGFAIPINSAKEVAEEIKKRGKVTRGWLGVQVMHKVTPDAMKKLNMPSLDEGAVVVAVIPDSPAAKAGLQVKDIIKTYNGRRIKSFTDLSSQVKNTFPGDKIKVQIRRGSQELSLTVKIEEMEEQDDY